jgi:hypothetical protein
MARLCVYVLTGKREKTAMSENVPPNPSEPQKQNPSSASEWWTLVKVVCGIAIIAFGIWRAWVFAFGPDESLFFAYRVKNDRIREMDKANKEFLQAMTKLKREIPDNGERADKAQELFKTLEDKKAERKERDSKAYRIERWMELLFIVFAASFGTAGVASGHGVLWRKKDKATQGSN